MKPALLLGIVMAIVPVLACTPASTTATKPAASGASAPAASPAAGGQQLSVKGLDTLKFDPATLTARAGQPITVTFQNTGQTLHDFSMNEGPAQPVKALAQPGQTATVTFTVDKPGTYTYFCSQPGHQEAGMKGALTVQ